MLDALRRLALFGELDDRMLETVAASSTRLDLPPGDCAPADAESHLYFLVAGTVRLAKPGAGVRTLAAGEPAAGFPLPLRSGFGLAGEGPFSLLQVPERFLRLGEGRVEDGFDALEIPPDVIDPEDFLAFYQTLRTGRAELPSMPDLAMRIGEVIDDEKTVNEDIARLIQMDPSLAATLMRVVNSAAYCGGARIETLQQAVARLGRQRVRNLVFSCILRNLFRTESRLLQERMRVLWAHSCHVSAISFVLAKHTPGLNPDRALLAGLIHNIGGIPIINAARNNPAVASAPEVLDPLVLHLSREIGELTLRQWDFDAELLEVARQADHWMRPGWAVPDYLDIVILAQLHAFIGGQRRGLPRIDEVPAFRKLALGELTPRHSIAILDGAQKEISEVTRLLQGR